MDKTNNYFATLKIEDGSDATDPTTNFCMTTYHLLSRPYKEMDTMSDETLAEMVCQKATEHRNGTSGPIGTHLGETIYHSFIDEYTTLVTTRGATTANELLKAHILDQLIKHSTFDSKTDIERTLLGTSNRVNELFGMGFTDKEEPPEIFDVTDDIRAYLRSTHPTDHLLLDEATLYKLGSYWITDDYLNKYHDFNEFMIPSDLIWANTVPIKDMVIEYKTDTKPKIRDTPLGVVVDTKSIRIIQFRQPDINDETTYTCMLGIVTMSDDSEYIVPFGIPNSESEYYKECIAMSNKVGVLKYGIYSTKKTIADDKYKISNMKAILNILSEYIPVWYGIQVGLLNPAIKLVFDKHTNPKYAIVETKKDRKGKKKTKIRYVRRVTITEEMFNECLERSYIRKKLCWYVTGHWRNQAVKDGHKRIFIQGYWKGVARDSKTADTREREVVISAPANQAPTQDDSWIDSLNKKYHI